MENSPASPQPLDTAVLLLVFNRLDSTKVVFEAIRKARPARLYVAADGPRDDRPGEARATEEVRRYLTESIDWDCDLQTLFRRENLGVKSAISGAIDWFFEHERMGIILEDDCLPSQSFFWFCQELLDRYQDDPRVMHIAGGCHIDDLGIDDSYYFSKYPHIWGWATWGDRWASYSDTSDDFEGEFRTMGELFGSAEEERYWHRTYRDYFAGKYHSWAYAWTFSVWRHRGLSVYPVRNLVKNIGFGGDALHTKGWKDYKEIRKMGLQSLSELRHPDEVELNRELDLRDFELFFKKPPAIVRALLVLRQMVKYAFASIRRRLIS